MKTLIVERDFKSAYNQTTILKTEKGKVIAIIREHTQQPRKNQETIVLTKLNKQTEYMLDWSQI